MATNMPDLINKLASAGLIVFRVVKMCRICDWRERQTRNDVIMSDKLYIHIVWPEKVPGPSKSRGTNMLNMLLPTDGGYKWIEYYSHIIRTWMDYAACALTRLPARDPRVSIFFLFVRHIGQSLVV